MNPSPSPGASGVLDVQVPGSAATPRGRRRAGLVAAGLASASAVLAPLAPAHAETYYTGQCSVSQRDPVSGDIWFRTFQARIVGSIENGTGKYIWDHYDYRYSVDLHLSSGPSSDENVSFRSGYSDGGSSNWQSPDNHGTSGDWIREGNWKGAKSYWGYTKVRFYAAFDVPGTPDPHCSAYTALV